MSRLFTTILSLIILTITLGYLASGCRKSDNPNSLTYLAQTVPAGFPEPSFRFAGNPLSREGFELGRKLFYDGRLSLDGNFPCSSCHQQEAAFGLFDHDRAHGYNNSHTLRNAPPLFNLAWQKGYHWDSAYTSIYAAIAQPINGHIEMAESFAGVTRKLQADPEYRAAFKKVFGTQFIQPDHILKALEQFTASLLSADSRYDRVKRGEASFTANEQSGYTLFLAKCNSCHTEPLFTDHRFRNNGLPVDPALNDFGKMMTTRQAKDSLLFKVPSLRNVAVSNNYMHDGRFNTLAQCLIHYRTNVQPGPTLDPQLAGGIPLTDTEIRHLVEFMGTLTDTGFVQNAALGKP